MARFTQKIFDLRYPDGNRKQLRVYIADEVDPYVERLEKQVLDMDEQVMKLRGEINRLIQEAKAERKPKNISEH